MTLHPRLPRAVDAHTHLSGSESGESSEGIVATLDDVGVEVAFVFAPLLNTQHYQLVAEDLNRIRTSNDYGADICSGAPERLYAFCVLNPAPRLADGDQAAAVRLMIDEATRCYHDLGVRGVKMVPAGWYPNDPQLKPLYETLAELGMYTVFHCGIFLDSKEGSFCRPTFFEAIHEVPDLRAQLAHGGWPWVDECLAVLAQETMTHGADPHDWQLRCDLSFGPPEDWQLPTWQRALDSLPHGMIAYASDCFWPMDAAEYVESYLLPQIAHFETAATLGHIAPEGSDQRAALRQAIFHGNALDHYRRAVSEPQQPKKAAGKLDTPRSLSGHQHRS
jgi:predicted TIM-barrel fold metal-dependent hydrolase